METTKDLTQTTAPEGAASGDGSQDQQQKLLAELEALRQKQAEQDRKITELSSEKQAMENRVEELTRSRQAALPAGDQQQSANGDIDRTLAEALNDAAIGNTDQAAQKLRTTFTHALSNSQREAVSIALQQLEQRTRLERHVEQRKREKSFVGTFEKEIARDAYARIQDSQMRGKFLSPEVAFDEAVADFETRHTTYIKQTVTSSPAPAGSQGERGSSGQQPKIEHADEDKAAANDDPYDYIASRKKRYEGLQSSGRGK